MGQTLAHQHHPRRSQPNNILIDEKENIYVIDFSETGTRNVLSWIARELSPRVHISLMAQYFPAHRATGDPVLGRRISPQEYVEALEAFDAALIECGWRQEYGEDEGCCPG